MLSCRLLFRKEGLEKYISHLDLMRTMQRAFVRAEIPIRHSEGFNPHPKMVFALPLSVGCESGCELLDVDLLADPELAVLPERLNCVLPAGIEVESAYVPERKFREIAWLAIHGELIYDTGTAETRGSELESFFRAPSLIIEKKGKRGAVELDIRPGIRELRWKSGGQGQIALDAVLSAQEPAINPDFLIRALQQNAPSLAPDFAAFRRTELFDKDMQVFR